MKVAQLEKEVNLPAELIEPWECMQDYFGCTSQSGNVMSNLVLNFDKSGKYVFEGNAGLPESITSAEKEFALIFRDIEKMVGLKLLISVTGSPLELFYAERGLGIYVVS